MNHIEEAKRDFRILGNLLASWITLKRFWGCLLLVSVVTACVPKTMTIKEETLLNTGEVIVVNRSMKYTMGIYSSSTTIFKHSESSWVRTWWFTYKGKEYVYEGKANLQLIAISPRGTPTLVAMLGDSGWPPNHRSQSVECIVPYYGQLIPDRTGANWSVEFPVDTWVHNLSTNLVRGDFPFTWSLERRFNLKEKAEWIRSELMRHFRTLEHPRSHIDPRFKSKFCVKK